MYSTTVTPFLNKTSIEIGAYACVTKPVSEKEQLVQAQYFKEIADNYFLRSNPSPTALVV
jgi:hypothetical protein